MFSWTTATKGGAFALSVSLAAIGIALLARRRESLSADEGDPDGDTTASTPKSSTGGLPYRIRVSNISDEDAERASRESPIEIKLPQIKVKPSAPPLKAKVSARKSRKLEGHFAPPPALFPGRSQPGRDPLAGPSGSAPDEAMGDRKAGGKRRNRKDKANRPNFGASLKRTGENTVKLRYHMCYEESLNEEKMRSVPEGYRRHVMAAKETWDRLELYREEATFWLLSHAEDLLTSRVRHYNTTLGGTNRESPVSVKCLMVDLRCKGKADPLDLAPLGVMDLMHWEWIPYDEIMDTFIDWRFPIEWARATVEANLKRFDAWSKGFYVIVAIGDDPWAADKTDGSESKGKMFTTSTLTVNMLSIVSLRVALLKQLGIEKECIARSSSAFEVMERGALSKLHESCAGNDFIEQSHDEETLARKLGVMVSKQYKERKRREALRARQEGGG